MLAVAFALVAVIASVAALLLLLYRFYFLRKPKRDIAEGDVVVSPANGQVIRILEIKAGKPIEVSKGLFGRVRLLTRDTIKEGYLIVIMMTPFNVHYQRAPVDGVVESIHHSKGSFLNVMKDAASLRSLENEKNEMLIRNRRIGKVKVVQVAGFLARRIKCFLRPKQKIHKGEEIGLICLGSQVMLVLPKLRLAVKEGQKVVDGKSIIARF